MSNLLDYIGVAKALGCSKSKVQKMVAAGELPFIKIGALTRIPDDALQQWIKDELQRKNCRDASASPEITPQERTLVSG